MTFHEVTLVDGEVRRPGHEAEVNPAARFEIDEGAGVDRPDESLRRRGSPLFREQTVEDRELAGDPGEKRDGGVPSRRELPA